MVEKTQEYAVIVEHATVRFNMASERIDNLKEYFVKFVKRELMFKEFLALKEISFKVKKGESWGIIGTNGSGKSTLLKLICGILKPYKGTVIMNGTVAPLIELGAGFDGDLTARENIFLNGAVLGYDKKFMLKHFDEIVDFAELRGFLDMPIKNYSSGMAARLGFAIATVVRPDILICDEVGSGIVPLERKDRIYREAVGRVLCAAVAKSDRVERILCGIGQCLKQESAGITK